MATIGTIFQISIIMLTNELGKKERQPTSTNYILKTLQGSFSGFKELLTTIWFSSGGDLFWTELNYLKEMWPTGRKQEI